LINNSNILRIKYPKYKKNRSVNYVEIIAALMEIEKVREECYTTSLYMRPSYKRANIKSFAESAVKGS
jgi:hypothetical protein